MKTTKKEARERKRRLILLSAAAAHCWSPVTSTWSQAELARLRYTSRFEKFYQWQCISVITMHNNRFNRNRCNPWSHGYEHLVTSSPITNQTKSPGRDMFCVYKMHKSSSAPPSDNYACILLHSATRSKAEPHR